SIPLWFTPYTSKIKAAKIKQQVAQINFENYSKSLIGNYNSLIEEYSKYSNSLDYYERQAIPEADLIIDQATKSYQTGSLDYFGYIQSLSRALSIKLNYLNALNDYNQTIISIDFIKGKIF
ncbi:MAG: TolC family protein, partial [Bacteroidales bacterium]|nr:TolC family protein [Bacteroidales bacterium]